MMWGYYDMGWGLWLPWLLLILLGIGLLIYVVIRSATRSRPPESSGSAADPRRILQERYARGEIDTDEFTERMRMLGDG
ncbi:MAG: SHOCT domain-containing protein [Microcella pacifica]|uniref:SHOCT domain-containing protein n=1 Tax=Microcella pacifica TaxID=2591847 RepID=A0A9E5JRJ6_9MICO|nr:SHOCT domain-containing protein [Microcella pacifica]NHF63547.1 SHOCT domain-containing protein [Microcella pacifica]